MSSQSDKNFVYKAFEKCENYEKNQLETESRKNSNENIGGKPYLNSIEIFASDTKCGFWFCNWTILERFANQSTFIIVYGFVGLVLSMTYAYFNGTITTLERRFHMSSRSIGVTQVGNDFTQMITSIFFIYYAGKSHRPRYMGLGVLTLFLYCVLTTLPHWMYGPGEEALKLTMEYGARGATNDNRTITYLEDNESLCDYERTSDHCRKKGVETVTRPAIVLFLAHSISGVGYSLYYSLGYSYMDDNVEKSQTASMYSLSYFLNMLGPSIGYTVAAFCLRQFISPNLNPIIDNKDPRWIGAWWLGWLIFGSMFFIAGILLSMFPKEMPARYRQRLNDQAKQNEALLKKNTEAYLENIASINTECTVQQKPSFIELLRTFKRLTKNKIFMVNNFSSVLYFFGYMPYWIFTPKYLEIQFRQNAAESNIYTGTVALVFTAVGVLVSGIVVSRRKPHARLMAGWNATVGFVTVIGLLSYSLIGCSDNENGIFVENMENNSNQSIMCAKSCHCEYVSYAPVCGENNLTFISPCHAGCKVQKINDNGQKTYYDCDCVMSAGLENATLLNKSSASYDQSLSEHLMRGRATPGACVVNCLKSFLIFLSVMCFLKFIGATIRANYFLIQVRSVSSDDKAVALALGMVMMSLLSFVPSPIFFGWLLDRMCLVWGKSCTEKGNCWLYDSYALRFALNWTSAFFVCLGAFCDCIVWHLVKNLNVFEDEKKAVEDKIGSSKELAQLGCNIIYTGTVALVFTAVGVLVSGIVVSRRKPHARLMAGWNATVGFVTVIGLLSYSLIGCSDNENGIFVENMENNSNQSIMCAKSCHCEYVSYAPVCGENNLTFISPCHAGCKVQKINDNGQKTYYDCDCVMSAGLENATLLNKSSASYDQSLSEHLMRGRATPGACVVNCLKSFLIFLSVMCFLKFIGATIRANYFLIQVRSVSSDDKAVALALGMVMMSLLSFVPSPIFFGWLLDRMCLVWGKSCTEKGNCWLYDSYALRFALNWTSAFFVCLGAFCDCIVWHLVKNLNVFEDEKKAVEDKIGSSKELAQLGCNM